MPSFPIGDMSQFFLNVNQTSAIKQRMQTLSQELSSGQVSDLAKALGGDTRRISSIDREIAILDGYRKTNGDLDRLLQQQSLLLTEANTLRMGLTTEFLTVTTGSTPNAVAESGVSGRAGFNKVVGMMNAAVGGRSLFAGAADDRAALAVGEDMLADISLAIGGATTLGAITAVLDTWFDDPTGGFSTMAYQGDTGPFPERKISNTEIVTLSARADDPAVRSYLKSLATAAIVDVMGPALAPDVSRALIEQAGTGLNAVSVDFVAFTATVGAAEARLAEVTTRQEAQRSAFAIARNGLTSADPYQTAVKLQDVQTQLELQFTMTARLQGLSLANFI